MPTFSPEQRLAIAITVPAVAFLLFLWYRRRQNLQNFEDEIEDDTQNTETQQEVATVFETTLEVKIPQSAAGAVIGRGGVVIKKIQKDTGTFINFKDDDEPRERGFGDEKLSAERTVVIKGEREKTRKAELILKKIVNEQPKICTDEYFVPQRACGKIIGRGGTTIRHLSKVSGARIVIDRNEIRPDAPRKCTITGTADQIANAKGLLEEKVEEHNMAMARKRMPAAQPLAPMSAQTLATAPVPAADSSLPQTVQYPLVDDYVEVFVSAVHNPGHFWVQLVKRHDAQQLDRLVQELTDEANTGHPESLVETVEVSDIVCAPFSHDDSWYRAKVTDINPDGTVDLYYVDYGDSGTVAKYRLRKLRDDQVQLPFQAIECHLANTKPKGGSWSVAAVDLFKEMVHYPDWLVIMTKIVKFSGHIPCLDIYDTTTDKDVHVNQEMVANGYAVHDPNHPPSPEQPVQDTGDDSKDSSTDVTDSGTRTSTKATVATQRQSTEDVEGPVEFYVVEPVTPKRFSPVKAALVKRVSKEYISPPAEDISTPKDQQGEETTAAQALELNSASSSTERLQFILEMEKEVMEVSHVADGNQSQTPESSTTSENRTLKRETPSTLKPEVEAIIKEEVSKAFEAELAPAEELIEKSSVAEVESTVMPLLNGASDKDMNVSTAAGAQQHSGITVNVPHRQVVALHDDDEELDTFSPSYHVTAHRSFVSSVSINREHPSPTGATITLIPSKEHTSSEDSSDKEIKEEVTKSGVFEAQPSSKFSEQSLDLVEDEKEGLMEATELKDSHIMDDKAAGWSLSDDDRRLNVDQDSVKEPEVVNSASEDEESEAIESDSESFVSALDEPASDTDSTSYDTARAQISTSTTSLDYTSAYGDTDTETLRGPHGNTPVNSDTEGEGEKTPKRRTSSEELDTELELTPKNSFTFEPRFGSEQDLGYRGDSEASTENLYQE